MTTRYGKTYDNVGNRYRVFSKDEQAIWPEGHRGCTKCRVVKPDDSFTTHPNGVRGRDQVCKHCRAQKSKADYRNTPYERVILNRARGRAKRNGLAFNLTLEDIVIPERCPVLGIPLVRSRKIMSDNSPSIDRMDPSLGYVKGNVAIISNRANRFKSNATSTELLLISCWMSQHSPGI